MHPELGEKAFAEWYESDELVEAIKQLLQCEEQDLQMGKSSIHILVVSRRCRVVQSPYQSTGSRFCSSMASR